MTDNYCEAEFHELIRLMGLGQIRNKFVGTAYESNLDLVDLYVLGEIEIDGERSIQDLADLIVQDRNTTSRSVANLVKIKCIEAIPHPQDQRKRKFILTSKGKKYLEIQNAGNREFLGTYLKKLNTQEIVDQSNFYHRVSDALNAPRVRIRPEEHPFIEPLRRITRACGFIGPNLFGSGHSSTEWHVLSGIQYTTAEITLSELSALLTMHIATLSQLLDRYESENLIIRSPSTNDKRKKKLALTAFGLARLKLIETHGKNALRKAFDQNSIDEVKKFLNNFRKHMGVQSATDNIVLREQLALKEIVNNDEIKSARAFLIYHSVRLRWHIHFEDTILNGNNLILSVSEGNGFAGVCEVTLDDQPKIINIAFNESLEDRNLLNEFISETMIHIQHKYQHEYLIAPTHLCNLLNLKKFKIIKISDNWHELKLIYKLNL